MLRHCVPAIALPCVLTGCGGGGESAESAADVAALSECSDSFEDTGSDTKMFATDGGTCNIGSDEVTISWFNAQQARDNYKEVGDTMGGGGSVVYGENWAIECTDLEPCQTVADRTGGDLS